MQYILRVIGLVALASTTSGQAADAVKGKTLTKENCTRCHGSEIYTRENRRVTSLPGLHKQVRRCEQMLGLTWFDEDIDNVSAHLNHQYYKFDK